MKKSDICNAFSAIVRNGEPGLADLQNLNYILWFPILDKSTGWYNTILEDGRIVEYNQKNDFVEKNRSENKIRIVFTREKQGDDCLFLGLYRLESTLPDKCIWKPIDSTNLSHI